MFNLTDLDQFKFIQTNLDPFKPIYDGLNRFEFHKSIEFKNSFWL